jgi:hypothetical protein
MTPETIIKAAAEDGVHLFLAVKAAGKPSAMDRWRPVIKEKKAEILAALAQGAGTAVDANGVNDGVSYCWWQLRYAASAPMEIAYCPPASYAEVMAGEPRAVSATPFEPNRQHTDSPLSDSQEALILQWLAEIGEIDADTISDLLNQCRTDADARQYFLRLAEKAK